MSANNVVPIDVKWASALIMRFKTMYGAKFDQNWGGTSPELLATQWSQDLAGFTGEEIKAGLDACKTRDWPPTLPEFMRLCRPHLEPENAFHTAVKGMIARSQGNVGEWTHPAIFWAAMRVGSHDILNNPYPSIKTRWGNALAEELTKTSWKEIPEIPVALPAPKADPKKIEESISAILKFTPSADGRSWARKILEKVDRKETVSIAAVRMARIALGVDSEVY